jgi:chromate transporter
MTAPDTAAPAPGPRELFRAFLIVGLSGFGGVLPFARRVLVEQRRWLGETDFNETLALCQSLPGPNIINMSIVVGSRFAGARGSLAALIGLIGAPVAIVIVLGALYGKYGAVGRLPGAILGLGAAAAGLVAATVVKMATPLLAAKPIHAVPVMALAFAGVGLLRLPLPWILLALGPVSIAAAWRMRP